MEPLLVVDNLSLSFKSYLGKVHAVRGVSFSLFPGETVAIVGESGCGKTATAQALVQLHPPTEVVIEQGAIFFETIDLLKQSRSFMRAIRGRHIAMIFQDPMTSLNPTMKIGTQIVESLRLHLKMNRRSAHTRALELLTLVEISDPKRRFYQYPHELSGGMRQRVMIAIALACHPKLLIADEPTTALDVTVQAQILDLLRTVQKKMKTTILLITHDLGIVAKLCDRVLVMYGGKIVESGPVDTIFSNPLHPYTQGLLASVPRLDQDPNRELEPIHGTPPNLISPPTGCAFHSRCKEALPICREKIPLPLAKGEKQHICCWKYSHDSIS